MTNTKTLLNGIFNPIHEVRKQIGELRSQEASVFHSPMTEQESRARLRALLKSKEAELTSGYGATVSEYVSSRHSSDDDIFSLFRHNRMTPIEVAIFFLGPDLVEERIMHMAAGGRQANALPGKDYSARLASIQKQINALEVEEEAYIRDAEANGFDFQRRPDADPAVVLGS